MAEIMVGPDVQRIAHMGTAGNCQTDRNPDASWPATCTCGETDLVVDVAPAPGPCVSSSFVGSESYLSEGGAWTNAASGYGMKKVEGVARPETPSLHSFAGYTGRTWPADQSSKVTRASTGSLGDRVSACVRLAGFTESMEGYTFTALFNTEYSLFKIASGGSLLLLQTYAVVPTLTDVFELRVEGDTLTPVVNETPLTPVVDTTYATGVPGIHAFTVAEADAIAAWAGCEV